MLYSRLKFRQKSRDTISLISCRENVTLSAARLQSQRGTYSTPKYILYSRKKGVGDGESVDEGLAKSCRVSRNVLASET